MKVLSLLLCGLTAFIGVNVYAQDIAPTWTISLYQQTSAPQETIAAGSIYTIGLFGELVEVPSLKGKTWQEADQLLAQLNLVGVKVSNLACTDDLVRNQNIPAGKKVVPGTRINLDLVAKVPNVVGLTLDEAYEVLEVENGFKMKYNPDWSSDFKVTDQKPKAGAVHRRGRDVDVVSMVRVPDLIGMSVDQAKQVLTESHLYADIPGYCEDADRVMRQSIRSGKQVMALSNVRLTPGTRVPDLIGLDQDSADRLLRRAGIDGTPVFRRVQTFDFRLHGRAVVDRQSIRPGEYVTRDTGMRVTLLRYVYTEPVVVPIQPGGGDYNGGGQGGNEGGGFGGGSGGGGGG